MSLRHTRKLRGRRVPTFDRITRKADDPMMGLDGLIPIGRHWIAVGKRRRWCYRNEYRKRKWVGWTITGTIGGIARDRPMSFSETMELFPEPMARAMFGPSEYMLELRRKLRIEA